MFILGDDPGRARYLGQLEPVAARLGLAERGPFLRLCATTPARRCAEFDVQVVCSRAEPFGLVTLEAMAQGRPVVVTDTGGSPEIVRDGVEGFLVPPGDAEALARRLDCLLDSPGLRLGNGPTAAAGGWRDAVQPGPSMLGQDRRVYRQVLGLPDSQARRPGYRLQDQHRPRTTGVTPSMISWTAITVSSNPISFSMILQPRAAQARQHHVRAHEDAAGQQQDGRHGGQHQGDAQVGRAPGASGP